MRMLRLFAASVFFPAIALASPLHDVLDAWGSARTDGERDAAADSFLRLAAGPDAAAALDLDPLTEQGFASLAAAQRERELSRLIALDTSLAQLASLVASEAVRLAKAEPERESERRIEALDALSAALSGDDDLRLERLRGASIERLAARTRNAVELLRANLGLRAHIEEVRAGAAPNADVLLALANSAEWRDLLDPYQSSESAFGTLDPDARSAALREFLDIDRAVKLLVRTACERAEARLEQGRIRDASTIAEALERLAEANAGPDDLELQKMTARAIAGKAEGIRQSLD